MSTHSPYKTTQSKMLFAGAASVAALILLNRMATSPPGIEAKPEKTAPAVVAESVGPVSQPERPAFLRDDRTKAAHVKLLVKQSGGDFDKLSRQDQTFLDTLSQGHGREMIRGMAEYNKKMQEAAKKKK